MVWTVTTCPALTRSSHVSPSPPAASALLTTADVAPGAKLIRAEPPGGGPGLTVGGTAVAGAAVAAPATVAEGAAVIASGVALLVGRGTAVAAVDVAARVAVAAMAVASSGGTNVTPASVSTGVGRATSSPRPRQAARKNTITVRPRKRDRPLRNILSTPNGYALTDRPRDNDATLAVYSFWVGRLLRMIQKGPGSRGQGRVLLPGPWNLAPAT